MIAAFSSVYPFFFHFVSRKALQLFLLCLRYGVWGCFLKMFSIKAREAILRET